MDAGHVFNKLIPELITMYITDMCTKILTCLLVPFPYKNADTALCTRQSLGYRCLINCDAIKHTRGLLCDGLATRF